MTVPQRAVAGAAFVAIAAAVGSAVAYSFAWPVAQGAAAGLAAAGVAVALGVWANRVLEPETVADERDDAAWQRESETTAAAMSERLRRLERPAFLARLVGAALGALGLATLVPLRSLGPAPGDALFHTQWRRGKRLVREDGSPIRLDRLNVDAVVTAFPEGAAGDARSSVVLIRLPEGMGRAVAGFVAYSKVCTHAGCAVALYRAEQHQLMCPCHQSVFDVLDEGRVVSGPADHALPRLPLRADDAYLRAGGDFPEPVGPGFWERA